MDGDIRIEMSSHGHGKVWIDGKEIGGVTAIEFMVDCNHPHAINRLKLTFLPRRVVITGPGKITFETSSP